MYICTHKYTIMRPKGSPNKGHRLRNTTVKFRISEDLLNEIKKFNTGVYYNTTISEFFIEAATKKIRTETRSIKDINFDVIDRP